SLETRRTLIPDDTKLSEQYRLVPGVLLGPWETVRRRRTTYLSVNNDTEDPTLGSCSRSSGLGNQLDRTLPSRSRPAAGSPGVLGTSGAADEVVRAAFPLCCRKAASLTPTPRENERPNSLCEVE